MKLVGCSFTTYRGAVRTVYMPMDDLTVLAGPNDTGKTSMLRALRAGASRGGDGLMPAGVDLWDGPAPGFVWFGHQDATALRFLRVCTDWRLTGLDDAAPLERRETGATPDRGTAGDNRERDSVLGSTHTWDQLLRLGVSPVADTTLVTGGSPLAAWIEMLERRGLVIPVAAREYLHKAIAGGDAIVAYELDAWGENELPAWMAYLCVPPEVLATGGLDHEFFPNLEYMRVPGAPVPVLPVGRLSDPWIPVPTSVPMKSFDALRREVESAIDALLQFMWEPDDDEDVTAGGPWHQSRDHGRSLRARPEASACCHTFGVVATRHLPDFVAHRYTVKLAVAPIDHWERDGRISIMLHDKTSGVRFQIDDSASGHQLWLHLALLETAQMFRRKAAEQAALRDPRANADEAGSPLTDHPRDVMEELLVLEDSDALSVGRPVGRLITRRAADDPPDDLDLKILTALGQPTLYLIDEPEQHLHPALQRSAAEWLQRLTEDGESQAVLATHAHTFLNLTQRTQYLATHRGRDHTIVAPFRPEHLSATDAFASEMGFDRGELLSRINVLLFVEGPADKRVIELLFEDDLRIAGIQLMEMGGVTRARAVLDDALVRLTRISKQRVGTWLGAHYQANWKRSCRPPHQGISIRGRSALRMIGL